MWAVESRAMHGYVFETGTSKKCEEHKTILCVQMVKTSPYLVWVAPPLLHPHQIQNGSAESSCGCV